MRFFDNLTNLIAQVAVGKSKTAADKFSFNLISAQELVALYRSDWLGRKIVDAPVFDMLREWRIWSSDANGKAIQDAEKQFLYGGKISNAARRARLYGGSAIIIGADTNRPDEPLKPSSIPKGGLKYLTVVTRYSLGTPELDLDVSSPTFGLPKSFDLSTTNNGVVKIHPSRVVPFFGADPLDMDFSPNIWGDSKLLAIYDAIHHAALAQSGVAELIHEAKIDIITVENLTSQLSTPEGTRRISERFTNANMLKSINNTLVLDAKEKWDRKQTTFAGLPDIIQTYLQIVAGASDIPATRLLGQAPKGLNATGDNDLRNYYDMLVGVREEDLGQQINVLDQVLWLHATGSIPRDVAPEWRPMWQLTPSEKADILLKKAQATAVYLTNGVFDEQAFREAITQQLIEDDAYPGMEAAIAKLQPPENEPAKEPAAQNNNPTADWAIGSCRDNVPLLSYRRR